MRDTKPTKEEVEAALEEQRLATLAYIEVENKLDILNRKASAARTRLTKAREAVRALTYDL